MTAAANIPYANPRTFTGTVNCPLCRQRPCRKVIYDHPVCKKCFYRFANRRQLGYLIDALILVIPNILIVRFLDGIFFAGSFSRGGFLAVYILNALIGLAVGCIFIMKDGFSGQSPGKRLTNMLVLDVNDGQPISFGQSFKRNSILLLGNVPIAGGFVALVIILVIAVQVGRGFRIGDRFAKTKVIWKRYATSPVFGGDALLCETCGYDLQGNLSGICPECGTAMSEQNKANLAIPVANIADELAPTAPI